MSISPVITFKAGACDLDATTTPPRVKPKTTPGYIYLYSEDELIHFCWRPRSASLNSPDLDLIMLPADGQFRPYEYNEQNGSSEPKNPTNGRIYVLKFSSSSQRHFFWMQSKSQSPSGDPSYFSARDLRLGTIVDQLIQGEEINVPSAIAHLNDDEDEDDGDGDNDEPMEDIEGIGDGSDHHRGGSGGAGPGATGGDIREEGEQSREGGADGGRADSNSASTTEASALVQNFLASLKSGSGGASQQGQAQDKPFTTLPDLLPPSSTLPIIESASNAFIDNLLSYLPPTLLLLAQEADDISSVEPNVETVQSAVEALSLEQKKDILRRVLRSPQFNQSLGSLTMALRDGGLPSVSEALGIKVEHGGFMRRGGMPLGGGEAVEAFLDGVERTVEEEANNEGDEGRMATD
ncbi:MAG: hypothetical protein M1837_001893 [Sclerophora amabilis]|nr:MAG: hypothetical protein M1837_001893 [Sclerophora amabilis]